MTRTTIDAREALAYRLNTTCLDPYPGTRPGNHFLTEKTDLNLSRANTFPKGFIMTSKDSPFTSSRFSKGGYNVRLNTFNIYYLTKEKISYTDSEDVKYEERDYLNYMKEQIITTLEDDTSLGSGYYVNNILRIDEIEELVSDEFPFKIYQSVIPIEIKWINKYGKE